MRHYGGGKHGEAAGLTGCTVEDVSEEGSRGDKPRGLTVVVEAKPGREEEKLEDEDEGNDRGREIE